MSPVLLGVFAALCWGVLDFAGRYASRGISAMTTVIWLTAAGLVGLTGVLVWRDTWPALQLSDLWLIVVMGAGFALATFWLFEALARGPVALVSSIAASYPVTALIIAVTMGARPGVIQWLAMVIVIAGVLIVAAAAVPGSHDRLTRNAFRTVVIRATLAHLSFAIAITAGQVAAPIHGEVNAMWLSRIAGLATLAVVALILQSRTGSVVWKIPLRWLPLIIVMGVLDVSALTALSAAGHLPDAEIATVTGSAFGVVTILLARVLLRERIRLVQWAGIVLVFAGGTLLTS